MKSLRSKLSVAALVVVTSGAATGAEDQPDVDDVLGKVEENLIGVWEFTDEDGITEVIHLRSDGIAIFNVHEEGEPMEAYICRYGASGGYLAMGESTDFLFADGEWEEDGVDELFRGLATYDVSDTTLTIHVPESDSMVFMKSNAEVLVPEKVTLHDGSSSVMGYSWGHVKAELTPAGQ